MERLEAFASRHGLQSYQWDGPVDAETASKRYSEVKSQYRGRGRGSSLKASGGGEGGSNEMYHLIPHRLSNGGVVFTDLYGHGTVRIHRRNDGLPEISGPRELFTILFGRSEADAAIRHISDGDYFNDK